MNAKNDILLSHSGKQHSYKLALSLQNLGRLAAFITSSYYDPSRFPDRLFSRFGRMDSFLKKRHEGGLSDKVRRFPFFEVPELVLRAFFGNNRFVSDAVCLRDALFDRFVARTQIRDCGIFWGFQGSCLAGLKEARKRGIIAVAEFATAHVTGAVEILEEEKKRNPEWADSITNLYFPEWYLERLKEEPFSADFCVAASTFSKKTLENAGINSRKILVLPLGVNTERFTLKKRKIKWPFQVLFVGSVGQRKGIKYLLDAIKRLDTDKIRLKIIGPIIGTGSTFRNYSRACEYLGLLGQDEIIRHMHECDCLVLPSLFEGFGLVIPEAMATGMPVIASTHTAAPDIIQQGIDGFIIEPCDVNGLSDKIGYMAANRKKTISMGENARKKAEEFSWENHRRKLKEILDFVNHKR
ncbi:MAG: glycosyltransferase family 4 protein [Candidatus Omnitrophota bacterium]